MNHDDAEHGRRLVDRLFEIRRVHAESHEWEQALAELRVWSMERPATSRGAVEEDERLRIENTRLKAAVASTQTYLGNLVRDIHQSGGQ